MRWDENNFIEISGDNHQTVIAKISSFKSIKTNFDSVLCCLFKSMWCSKVVSSGLLGSDILRRPKKFRCRRFWITLKRNKIFQFCNKHDEISLSKNFLEWTFLNNYFTNWEFMWGLRHPYLLTKPNELDQILKRYIKEDILRFNMIY